MSNKLTIEIYGTQYPITTSEDRAYVKSLGKEIDRQVFTLMRSGNLALNQAFLLVALQYLDAFKKSEAAADHLRTQVAEYMEDAFEARVELERVQQLLDRLEQEKK